MRIGVIGVGLVGSAISFGFRRIGHEVLQHDIRMDTKLADVLPAPVIFICVPTPQAIDGSCDTSQVETVIAELISAGYSGLIAIKSTVTPGTTDRLSKQWPSLRLAFCPEFLRERAAFSDFVEQNDICIAGVYRDEDCDIIRQAHGSLPKAFERMQPLDAELSKYFANIFNALRVVFANQFYEVCEAAGADYSTIKNAIVKRSNIGDHYLECNWQFRGFSGSCLPKDTAAFMSYVRDLGVDAPIFAHIVNYNKKLCLS